MWTQLLKFNESHKIKWYVFYEAPHCIIDEKNKE